MKRFLAFSRQVGLARRHVSRDWAGTPNRCSSSIGRAGSAAKAFAAMACLLLGSLSVSPARAIEGWKEDADEAFADAAVSGRPILALFTGSDWCPHCRLLEERVLTTESFASWADGRVELLVVDMPRQGLSAEEREKRSAVCRRYGVKTFPNVMLIAPDGSKIAAQPGYGRQPADAWIAGMDHKLASWTAAAKAAVNAAAALPGGTATPDGTAAPDETVQEAVQDAVREAKGSKRPVLLVVSRSTDQDGRIRAASLVNDPEFRSFAKDHFVVAEIATGQGAAAEPATSPAEPLHSLLGGVPLPSDEVEVIVTYDGRTPMYTQSGRQPTPRLINGLRRFLGARPTARR